jgi:hypothetical protein
VQERRRAQQLEYDVLAVVESLTRGGVAADADVIVGTMGRREHQ